MAIPPQRRITYDDYVTFPDDQRWEVIDGEAFVVPSPNRRHQEVALEFAAEVKLHLDQHGGGHVFIAPFDVVLGESDIVQPDVIFVSDSDAGVITDANIRGRPTWLVEVVSPSEPARDRVRKLRLYERYQVPEYWIVDPAAGTVEIYRIEGGSYGSPAVLSSDDVARPVSPAGLALDLTKLFSDL